jgi:methylthioribulose-1-phosphate dehydratase
METQVRPSEPSADFLRHAGDVAELARYACGRGWAFGTSGNFSAVLSDAPLRLAITGSGVDKARIAPEHIVEVDDAGTVVSGSRRPSDETHLHLAIVRVRGARAVAHTHSVWSTLLSEANASAGGFALEGYEMLKGLSGVKTHKHREWLPALDNSQDMTALARDVEGLLSRHPASHGFLLRRHGLYTWGRDLDEARRHLEVLEFLLEVTGRLRAGGIR